MKQLKNGRGLTDSQMGFLLIVPGLAVFLAIILYPFVDAVITSFTDRSLIYPDYKFVAFANYAKVFKDPYFGKTLITTLLFVLGSTVLPYTLGMIWAIDLNQGFKGRRISARRDPRKLDHSRHGPSASSGAGSLMASTVF